MIDNQFQKKLCDMANSCGSCTMCCKLMPVSDFKKPKNQVCEHCNVGHGCRIYDDRPDNCRSFRCIWLQTQALHYSAMSLQLRPDKSKVVLHTTPDEKSIVARVDPNYPNAWKANGIGRLLGELSQKLIVLLDNGKSTWLLSKGNARLVQMSAADETGAEHFERFLE